MLFTARARDEHMNACARVTNTWTTYRYIHTYIHKYSDFLVVLISVGLALARPND